MSIQISKKGIERLVELCCQIQRLGIEIPGTPKGEDTAIKIIERAVEDALAMLMQEPPEAVPEKPCYSCGGGGGGFGPFAKCPACKGKGYHD
jgi:hypothetical protein